MTLQQHPLSEALPAASPAPPGRWWSWQRVARMAWVVLALVLLVIFVANIPAYYQSLNTFCAQPSPENCPTGQLTLGNVQALGQLHLSVTAAAGFLATLTLAVSVLYWLVGLLIFWRKSQEWMGLLFSLTFVMFGAIDILDSLAPRRRPACPTPDHYHSFCADPCRVCLFYYLSHWALHPALDMGRVRRSIVLITLPFVPGLVVSILTVLLLVGVQVYRYVRVYDAVQRQQTKWFVFGSGVGLFFFAIYNVLGAVVPGLSASDSWYQLLNVLPWPCSGRFCS